MKNIFNNKNRSTLKDLQSKLHREVVDITNVKIIKQKEIFRVYEVKNSNLLVLWNEVFYTDMAAKQYIKTVRGSL